MKITFLGTGTSVGVPRIGCECPVCTSTDRRNKRLRCSIVVEYFEHSILVDTPPDLRTQALRNDVRSVDAVLFTHGHADHLHGLDDVRAYCFGRDDPIPVYGDRPTLDRITRVFDYAFDSAWAQAVPRLSLHPIEGDLELFGLQVRPVPIIHGRTPVLAFRFGRFAYVTDCSEIPEDSMNMLRGLDVLVLGALRHKEHPTHFTIEQALGVVDELKPRHTYFTHMAHDLDHYETNDYLPDHVELAYDGLVIDVA